MIDVALVGAGRMGALHARTLAHSPHTRLRRIYDIDSGRAHALAQLHDAEVGPPLGALVVVATPASTHLEVATPLLKHHAVLVEKPLAVSAEQAEFLDHERCRVGHSERFHPAVRSTVSAHTLHVRRFAPPGDRGRDVDVIADLLVHDLDLMRCWMGDATPIEVSGERHHGMWEQVSVQLANARGRAFLEVDRRAPQPMRTVEIDGDIHDLTGAQDNPDALTAQLHAVLADLGLADIEVEGPLPARPRDGVAVLALADAIRQRLG